MTVTYDAEDHLGIIFRIHGSVLPKVLPWCAFNVAVACLVWSTRYFGLFNPTFNGGLGYQYIAVLVSFFVVSNVNTTYNRFWEARGFLGNGLFSISKLVERLAVYSGRETHEKAKMWRRILKIRITRLLRFSMYLIQEDRLSLINRMSESTYDHGDLEQVHALFSHTKNYKPYSVLMNEMDIDPSNTDVDTLVFAVDAAIRSHAEFLDDPLHISEQMDLLGKVHSFLDAYGGLIKNSTTPRPFPIVQMGRTLVCVWVLSLPFALGGTQDETIGGLVELIFLVFLVTYGFTGMVAAEIEMHDPLGSDANDLETDRYTAFTLRDLDRFLGDNADFSVGYNFQEDAQLKEEAGKEYGAI